ncbi:methylmalonyl-CoA mutase, coenzyme B12-dependent alpha subunit [Streptomyces sp. SPB074]|uniref:methylmalonyl-CoA mutase, coenzyme B12-dependent alpha subunit n=1 Tax=Streptomyces sp. (strain SPB074) TaxID=465543 RepID=UPI0001D1DF2D|nr:methylmalonyl-CoA mutase, coenzyme B12-dependent alpha subunit [Streptomyces sp. SPB074]EFG64365.1 methylmalonyl-CoA mutase, coenzyme B12-dependent alpha subunit [Streptomyces sp. SPB074]
MRLRGDLGVYAAAWLPRWALSPGALPARGATSARPGEEAAAVAALARWRATREESTDRQGLADPYLWPSVRQSLDRLADAAIDGDCLVEATLDCVRAGVTTGEWARTLRAALGTYEAPTHAAPASYEAPAASPVPAAYEAPHASRTSPAPYRSARHRAPAGTR